MVEVKRKTIDKDLFFGLLIALGCSMICPEYIAPFFIFALYIHFIKHFKKTNRNAKLGTMGKVFFAYMGYMLISSIWSATHLLSGLIALLWMGCFLGYIAVANIVNTKEKLKDAITAVNISAGVIGLIAIIEFVSYNLSVHVDKISYRFPNPLYYDLSSFIFSLFPFEIQNHHFPSRAASTFDNPLILATYLVITVPFCAFGSTFFKHSKNRKISRVCFVLAAGGLAATESRGAYIAIGLAIVTMLISNQKLFKKLFPFVVALAFALPITMAIRYKNSPKGDFLSSNTNRFSIWASCLKMFKKSPVFGLGAGTENIHQELVNTYHIDRTHAHNLFIELLVEGGIVGVIFLGLVIYVLIKCLYSLFVKKNKLYRPYAILYTSSLVGFIIMSLFEHTMQSPKEIMMFFFYLGFIEATRRLSSDEMQLARDEMLSYEEFNDNDFITDKEEMKANI